MLAEERLVLMKIETTEGDDANPVIATDLMRTINSQIEPLKYDEDTLNVDQPFGGALPVRLRRKRTEITLPFLGVPSGTAGTAPEGAGAFRSCGLAQVVTADTDVQYSPVLSGFESSSVYFNQSGTQHKSLGFKANLKAEFNQGQDPLYTATGIGEFAMPTAVPLGVPDFTGFNAPIEVNEANTTFLIDGVEYDLESLSFDAALPLSFISRTKQTGVKVGKRQPSANISITAPTLAEKNFFLDVVNEGTAPMKLIHGTAAGSITELDFFAGQLLEPSYGEADDDLMLGMKINVRPDATGNDWRLTFK